MANPADVEKTLHSAAELARKETVRRRATRYSEISPNLQFAEYVSGELPVETQLFAEKLRKTLQPRKFALRTTMQIGRQVKYVRVTIPAKFDRLELLHFTDLQWGSPQCLTERVREYRDWVLKAPNRFVLFGGDMMDLATMLSVGRGAIDQRIDPDEQVYSLAEFLAPMAHRVLGYCGGNHEYRGHKIGHDFGLALATALSIPYSSGVQHIDINFGKWTPFKAYLWHGRGAARTKGAKAQMMWSVVQNDRANLYINGHIHDSLVLPGTHVDRDFKTGRITQEKFYCVSSTSFQSYYGGYAESAFFPPSYLLMGCTLLYKNGHFRISI